MTKHEGTAANHEPAVIASRQNPRDKAEFVIGNMLFVGFHEMGHALADQFHLPTLGRAEDAADSFATIALLDAESEFSVNLLVQAARGLFLSDRRDRRQREELDFSEAHSLDKQRAYQIICLMVGSDQKRFKELADRVRMPRDRQRTCANDYDDAKYAWHSLLDWRRHTDGEPTGTIEIACETDQGNLERYARSFQSVALLEAPTISPAAAMTSLLCVVADVCLRFIFAGTLIQSASGRRVIETLVAATLMSIPSVLSCLPFAEQLRISET